VKCASDDGAAAAPDRVPGLRAPKRSKKTDMIFSRRAFEIHQ
jgi:hypothetical protein